MRIDAKDREERMEAFFQTVARTAGQTKRAALPDRFQAWLFMVVRNAAFDMLRELRANSVSGNAAQKALDSAPAREDFVRELEFVRLYDSASGREQALLDGCGALCLAFSPDGKVLACGDSKAVRLWRAATDQDVFDYHETDLRFSPDDTERRLDFIRASWGLYLHLRGREKFAEALPVLDQGREQFVRLRGEANLRDDQQRWLRAFNDALTHARARR